MQQLRKGLQGIESVFGLCLILGVEVWFGFELGLGLGFGLGIGLELGFGLGESMLLIVCDAYRCAAYAHTVRYWPYMGF